MPSAPLGYPARNANLELLAWGAPYLIMNFYLFFKSLNTQACCPASAS